MTAIAVAAVAAIMAAAALGLGQPNRTPAPAAAAPVIPNGQSRLFIVELGDIPAAGQYEMLDHHLDHAAAGAAGYIDASAPGRRCSLAHIRPGFLAVYTVLLIKTIITKNSRLPPDRQRKETKA